MKTYRIDIYADIDENDIGVPLKIDVGELRDLTTGTIYTGKIIISDLEPIGQNFQNPFDEK